MKELTNIKCKCGAHTVYRFGAFLQCQSCMALYYEVDGKNEELPDRYYPSSNSTADILDQIFAPVLENISPKVIASLQAGKASEVYVPYLNIITRKKEDTLIPAANIETTSGSLNGEEVPVLQYSDIRLSKSSDKSDCPTDKIAEADAETASEIITALAPEYISEEIYYVQLKSFCFQYKGAEYRYLAYGDHVFATKGNLSEVLEEAGKRKFIRQLLNAILILGVVVCAAITFCASYIDAHGLFSMFIWNTGYMCVFRFLGAAILGSFAVRLFWSSLDNIIDTNMMIRKEKLLEKAKLTFGGQYKMEE